MSRRWAWSTWPILAAYAALHLLFPPRAYNTHAIMYPIVAELGGSNSLEIFHPLYVPILRFIRALRHLLGLGGLPLFSYQLFSLAGALLNLWLVYQIARQTLEDRRRAFWACFLATASINLWAWSMQTMPYTWATAAALGALGLLLRPTLSLPAAALMGLLTGVAAGLDTACLALVPVFLAEAFLRRGPRWKIIGHFLAGALFSAAMSYLLFFALRVRASSPLPEDIVTLYHSRSLAVQISEWIRSTAPSDAPWIFFATFFGLAAWLAAKERAARVGLLFFLAVSFFFFVNDPHNRFIYASALMFPVLLPAAVSTMKWPIALIPATWALLVAKSLLWPADYLPVRNPGFDEAEFVSSFMKPDDVLFSLSQPDLAFAYAYRRDIPIADPGPALSARISAALCSGKRVVLASDWLFRDSRVTPAALDARADQVAAALRREFALDTPIISPGSQYYYPILLKPGSSVCAKVGIIKPKQSDQAF